VVGGVGGVPGHGPEPVEVVRVQPGCGLNGLQEQLHLTAKSGCVLGAGRWT
jgi:hypothetical protein